MSSIETYNDYTLAVRRTLRPATKPELAVLCLGIAGELGELVTAFDQDYREELGDLAWYLFAYADTYTALSGPEDPVDFICGGAVCVVDPIAAGRELAKSPTTWRALSALCEHTKKVVGHGRPYNPALVSTCLEVLMEPLRAFHQADIYSILTENVTKLEARYPRGVESL